MWGRQVATAVSKSGWSGCRCPRHVVSTTTTRNARNVSQECMQGTSASNHKPAQLPSSSNCNLNRSKRCEKSVTQHPLRSATPPSPTTRATQLSLLCGLAVKEAQCSGSKSGHNGSSSVPIMMGRPMTAYTCTGLTQRIGAPPCALRTSTSTSIRKHNAPSRANCTPVHGACSHTCKHAGCPQAARQAMCPQPNPGAPI